MQAALATSAIAQQSSPSGQITKDIFSESIQNQMCI